MRVALFAALALLFTALGCSDQAPTRIVVRFESDMVPRDELVGITAALTREGEAVAFSSRRYNLGGSFALPGDVVVTAQNPDDGRRLVVDVTAAVVGGTSFSQRAITRFERGRTLYLQFFLARRCANTLCPRGTTCGRSGCEAEERPALAAPVVHDAEVVDVPADGMGDAPSEAAVFDGGGAPDASDGGDIPPVEDVSAAPDLPPGVDVTVADAQAPDLPTATDVPPAVDVPSMRDVADVADVADIPMLAPCPGRFGDCDGNASNGDETNLCGSASHCGTCNNVCPSGSNGSATCTEGVCSLICLSGHHLCAGRCVSDTDATACGAGCLACANPANGMGSCTAGRCAVACNPGFTASGTRCLPAAPRLLSPLSTFRVTTLSPTLYWSNANGVSGAHVQLCSDRACSRVDSEQDVEGASVRLTMLSAGVHYWRVAGRASGITGDAYSAVWEFFVPTRETGRDLVGNRVADYNGDGRADLVVGLLGEARQPASPAGSAYAYLGPISATSSPDRVLVPSQNPGAFPNGSAAAGDVNGDGFGDYVGLTQITNSGGAYVQVFYGSRDGLPETPSTSIRTPVGIAESQAEGIGDVNGDGYGDVLVCGQFNSILRFFVYAGGTSGLTLLGPTYEGAGSSVVRFAAGDINGDRFADLVHHSTSGIAVVVRTGGASGLSAATTLTATGSGIATADVNGDGLTDIVVGAAGSGANGTLSVYLGRQGMLPATLPLQFGVTQGTGAAQTLLSPGDMTGDGYDDLLVLDQAQPSRVGVLRGGMDGLERTLQTTFSVSVTRAYGGIGFPYAFGVGGDVTGDGLADVVFGYDSQRSVAIYRGRMGAGVDTAAAQVITLSGLVGTRYGWNVAARSRVSPPVGK